jgi:hypothetical protein
MSKQRKILLWLGLVISVPATSYFAMCVVFYSWQNAANPERWPVAKAGLWAGGAIFLTILFVGLFLYCLICLITYTNKEYGDK